MFNVRSMDPISMTTSVVEIGQVNESQVLKMIKEIKGKKKIKFFFDKPS
jgi:hypothetical protein